MNSPTDFEILAFATGSEWKQWLNKNHKLSKGIWIRFYKKGSGITTVSYDEVLDEALCYGWIDGQLKKYDEQSWLHKFTPRRTRSTWSKRNIGHVTRLIKQGRMENAGLKEIEKAKQDGRWENAYDSTGNAKIPDYFLKELSKNKNANDFYNTLNKVNVYSITWRLQTARKPETREKRMKAILKMLERKEKFH
jgi:uncharacterized protein YdeI (YjbR/CyaY-like superfamily)